MQHKEKRIAINALLTVVKVIKLSANFIRIGFTSDKPLTINPLWIVPHLKLQFANAKTGKLTFPSRDEENKIIWQEGMRERVRTYSIRQYDFNLQQLFVDFVIHSSGVASVWAQQAKIGDQIGLLGMGSKRQFSDNHLVLIGDHAATPAICYTIEQKPKNQKITAFIEVNDATDITQFQHNEQLAVKWQVRPHGQASKLIESVLNYPFESSDNLLFCGGMEGELTQQLRHKLKEKYPTLASDAIQVINYWREGLAEGEFKHRD